MSSTTNSLAAKKAKGNGNGLPHNSLNNASGHGLLQPPEEQSHRLLGNHQKVIKYLKIIYIKYYNVHFQMNGRKGSSSPSPSDNEFGTGSMPMGQSKLSSRVMFSSESVAIEPNLLEEGQNGSSSDMMVSGKWATSSFGQLGAIYNN